MRKINLSNYDFQGVDFEVRSSLANILFMENKLDGREVIRRDELARKIEDHPEDDILLEESDWKKLVNSLNATDLKPHGRSIVEFVRRVLDAPEVDVVEKDK